MTGDSPARIRGYQPGDLDRVCDIAVRAWEPIFAHFAERIGDPEMAEAYCRDWDQRKAEQVRSFCINHPEWVIVTELDGQVVGFLTMFLDRERSFGEIGNNAIEPAFQGRGLGAAQYERALEFFREQGMKFARVNTGLDPSHAPARAAYEKVGFEQKLPSVQYMRRL